MFFKKVVFKKVLKSSRIEKLESQVGFLPEGL
jgi:hypothetical protein